MQPIKIDEVNLANDSKGMKKLRNMSLLEYKKTMDERKSHLTTFRAKFAHRNSSTMDKK